LFSILFNQYNSPNGGKENYDEDNRLPDNAPENLERKVAVNVFRKLNGVPNKELIGEMRENMIERLMMKPGMTREQILQSNPVMHQPSVEYILEMLLREQLVYTKRVERPVVDNRHKNPIFFDEEEADICFDECFYANVDAIVRCNEYK
jgi:hypothetical protein